MPYLEEGVYALPRPAARHAGRDKDVRARRLLWRVALPTLTRSLWRSVTIGAKSGGGLLGVFGLRMALGGAARRREKIPNRA